MGENQVLLSRIIINPKVMVGKPIIKGTRLTVQHILGLLAQGLTIREIMKEYPNLIQEDIIACLLFASETLNNVTFLPLSNKV